MSKITSLELPNTLSSLGSLAYSRIKSIDLPEALLGISDYGFYGCYSLRDLVIPDKVKTIGNYAFANCIGLTHVHLGKSVETIGENVFLNSDSLTSITVDEENPYFMVEECLLLSILYNLEREKPLSAINFLAKRHLLNRYNPRKHLLQYP